jgi:hypothetical protein
MKRPAKKYQPGHRLVVRSRDEIPSRFASEEEEREWWATHELADDLLPSEGEMDRLTAEHRALIRRLQAGEVGVRRHRPIISKRKRA